MKLEHAVGLLLTFLTGYLMYLIMLPFFNPIFRATVLVVVSYPYFLWLLRRVTKNRSVASLIASTTVALVVAAPLTLVGATLADELHGLYLWSENYLQDLSAHTGSSSIPLLSLLERYLEQLFRISEIDLSGILANSVKGAASSVTEWLKDAIRNFAEFLIDLLLSFFVMFFMFRDGDRLLAALKGLLPLPDREVEKIMLKNRVLITATFYGGVVVGAVQGLLGGLAFYFLGLPSPVLWGAVMFLFSFVPGIGTALVWLPASFFLFVTGSPVKAIVLFLWGAFAVSLIDNLLHPLLVSKKTELHPLLLLFSIFGALNVFGLIGLIAGPLILSFSLTVLEYYRIKKDKYSDF